MEHPEYLYNEFSDEEYVRVTRKVSTPEAAREFLEDLIGSPYDEIEISDKPMWLKRGVGLPEGMEGSIDAYDWYGPAPDGLDDSEAVAYWKTML